MNYATITLTIPYPDLINLVVWYAWGSILSSLVIMYHHMKHTIDLSYSSRQLNGIQVVFTFVCILLFYPLVWAMFYLDKKGKL